jgi:hypothetical protein
MQKIVAKCNILHAVKTLNQDNKKNLKQKVLHYIMLSIPYAVITSCYRKRL